MGAPPASSLAARFWVKAQPDPAGGCWGWHGAPTAAGYSTLSFDKQHHYAHRVSWEIHHGPIPEGFEIDHLCRNRACPNPAHLDAVLPIENIRRGLGHGSEQACPQGHLYSDENTYRPARGGRMCRTCMREFDRRRYPTRVYDPVARHQTYLRKRERERDV